MSYILDALRKAEAERERGHVPGIHAQQPLAGAAPTADAPPATRWVAVGIAVVAALVIGGGLVWWKLGAGAPATTLASSSAPAAGGSVPPTSSPTTAATPSPTTATTPPLPAISPAPEPARVPPKNETGTTLADAARIGGAKMSPGSKSPTQQAETSGPTTNVAPSNTAPQSARPAPLPTQPTNSGGDGPLPGKVYTIGELPDAIRSQLPTLTVGGSMYSPNKANRVLIVNGQVAHEGDIIAPEVVLEQLRVKSAVLTFKGYRYSLPF